MKKLILLYFITVTFIFSQTNISEYNIFIQAKNNYLNGEYENGKLEFNNLETNYKNSKLIKTHYPDYYIGMNYYELGELKKALKYLDSSIYTPKYIKKSPKSNFFEFERAFYLGEIYTRLGYETNARYQYLSLIKDYYTPDLAKYEKKTLNILASKEPYYDFLLQAKYYSNYKDIDKLKESDLRSLSKYLYSKGEFLDFYKAYKELENSGFGNKDAVISTLNILEESKQYKLMTELINKQQKNNKMERDYFYYWGNALKKTGKTNEAIEKYKEAFGTSYNDEAIYSIARIYFIQRDYNNGILWAKKLKGDKGHELLTRSYFNSGQMELFKESAVEYIKSYPNSNLAGYYRNMLYNESKNPNYLNWIIKHNLNSYYYQVAFNITKTARELEEYPINYKTRVYKEVLAPLEEISLLGDPQLLIIYIDNNINFPDDIVFENYIKAKYLEKIGLYNLAMLTSKASEDGFAKYSNLYPYLYPRYYYELVKKYSQKYDVEEALIFSILKESSSFDKNLIYKGSYFGLMQIDLKTAKKYNPNITSEDLLQPNINIDISVQHLSYLLAKYNNNTSKTIAGYHDGENEIDKWAIDPNGDIDVEQIPYFESQEFIKNTITNYYKYKGLYKE